ncbi:hypothetical protein PLICRDRAFT_116583 [Plicaturopsis crispa FD-325 SS-3]|uniref:Unplaced genomic scaffold PLICRscaffold_15, whole genome shotgun sequence n=1 Tax=Plicaturopsis crispa FD-325 SS-3 TaxID=944288 RepID=A0A0C9TA80_PLICR|nr:hypothetical protein PLICRDRAFT_116583 [Plicaturopsis crispa FD-325 SS-3]
MADEGSTFINGAATSGPAAEPDIDDSVHFRASNAEELLTPKQRKTIEKDERKQGKRLSKVIQKEAASEKAALTVSIAELAELQKLQKTAVKREAAAHSAYTKTLTATLKAEEAYLAAQVKFRALEAELAEREESLKVARDGARGATERMAEKMKEVERVRVLRGVDERERGVKVAQLKAKLK